MNKIPTTAANGTTSSSRLRRFMASLLAGWVRSTMPMMNFAHQLISLGGRTPTLLRTPKTRVVRLGAYLVEQFHGVVPEQQTGNENEQERPEDEPTVLGGVGFAQLLG